jgi:hypothetical protein
MVSVRKSAPSEEPQQPASAGPNRLMGDQTSSPASSAAEWSRSRALAAVEVDGSRVEIRLGRLVLAHELEQAAEMVSLQGLEAFVTQDLQTHGDIAWNAYRELAARMSADTRAIQDGLRDVALIEVVGDDLSITLRGSRG